MFEVLQAHIAKHVELTDEEFERCTQLFIPKKVRKRGFLVQEGDICKQIAFVTKGCLRSYTVDDKGAEHVLQFAIEGWWISDMCSFSTGEPATSYIILCDGAAKDGYGNLKAGFKATAVINRFDYGLKWNVLTEAGGAVVGKNVNVTLNFEFTQQKAS